MLLAMLVMGCEDATPSWDLLDPFGPADPVASAPLGGVAPPALAHKLTAAEDDLADAMTDAAGDDADPEGFDNPWGPNADDAEAAAVDAAEEAAEEPQAAPGEPAPVAAAPAESALAFGLPNSAAWGVRLLGTLANAQPPRAALGLPDGSEVVVTPGSMLPSVGIVVITVGQDVVQVARVSPAGDHAEVEMVNLVAQYARTATGQ